MLKITSCQFFRLFFRVRLPEIFICSKSPLAFIADFGLRKVVLRAETRFAIIKLHRKKIKTLGVSVIPVGQKVVS